jgi:hypothetical protein
MPLVRVFALLAAMRAREDGHVAGPDYADMEALEALEAADHG